MKKLLITGFDPFGGEKINPSWEAAKRLPDRIGSCTLTKIELPTVYSKAAELALERAEAIRPDVILCLGQAGGRRGITPEVVAINLREASIADNAGNLIVNQPVLPHGENAYFSTLPVRNMVNAIKAVGIETSLSYSAGAFVCNDLLYTLLHAYRNTDVRVGFIHLPFVPEQVEKKADGTPCMSLDDMEKALIAAISCLE